MKARNLNRACKVLAAGLALLVGLAGCAAQAPTSARQGEAPQPTVVHFPSLDGPPATQLDGYLFPAPGAGRHPAVVFLHGCSGLLARSGKIYSREMDWAKWLNAAGITVLMVDSLNPRHHGGMCAPATFEASIYRARPLDAYAALQYLQGLPDIRPDRIGAIGWSQGGGVVLDAIRSTSPARSAAQSIGNFRAAVAFYPARCSISAQGPAWRSPVPLLLLQGAKDVWTDPVPCERLMHSVAPGTDATMQIYPNAYHDFDWPDLPVRRLPAFTTRRGIVPIEGTDPEAREDARQRVIAFMAGHLLAP
jgi:dienelactone hydrolase